MMVHVTYLSNHFLFICSVLHEILSEEGRSSKNCNGNKNCVDFVFPPTKSGKFQISDDLHECKCQYCAVIYQVHTCINFWQICYKLLVKIIGHLKWL